VRVREGTVRLDLGVGGRFRWYSDAWPDGEGCMLQHTKGDPSERRPLDKCQGVVGSGQGKEGESKNGGRGLKRSGEWEKRAGLGPSGVGSEDGRLQFNWPSARIQFTCTRVPP
jgi:hypothetical protein